MKIFKDFKLGTKVSIGYGLILFLLVSTFFIHLVNLYWFQDNFEKFGNIAEDQMLAGRIQANLLESRIAYENFVLFGEDTQKIIFEERINKMEEFIFELKEGINNFERAKEINEIQEHASEYKENFIKIVEYKGQRDTLYDILQLTGPQMEGNATMLVEESYSSGDMIISHNAGLVLNHLLLARLNVAKFLENNNEEYIVEANKNLVALEQSINVLVSPNNSPHEKELIESLKRDKIEYEEKFNEIVTVIEDRNEVISILKENAPEISEHAENIKLSIIDEQKTYDPMIKHEIQLIIYRILILSVIGIIFAVLISIRMTRLIVLPLKTVTNTFKEISEGDANLEVRLKVDSKDELGEMSDFFNKFMCKLQAIITQNKNQSWIKNGQAELNESVQSEQDLNELSKNMISYIARYIDAQIGAIYLKNENSLYQLSGSYAYQKIIRITNDIRPGEGLVGQAIIEKQINVIRNVPSDYISVSSGLGEALPQNIVVVPCLLNGDVICVIELGSLSRFSDLQLEFLDIIRDSIAICLHSAEAQIKLKELLDKTVLQSEELQLQQEELRQSNEELEEQALALRESEERLQMQQEELRVTNEELVERTNVLEIQKSDISKKNDSLIKAREEIEEKAKALETASTYKSEFFANMSHELRTPLNSILVLSQLLANKKDNEPLTIKQMEFANTIYSAGTDLLRLINDILDMSKVEAGKLIINLEEVNLRDISDNCDKIFGQIAKNKGLEFIIEIDKDLPTFILTDAQRVQQILNNLLSNAFKFTEQGSVTLKIVPQTKDKLADLSINCERAIELRITDTGIGVPTDKQQEIFEAFRQSDGTTSRKYGGTGLGLYITKKLTELLGGIIKVESQEGIGSNFSLILPINQNNTIDIKQETNLLQPLIANKESKVLVYEGLQTKIKESDSFIKNNDSTLLIIEDDLNFAQILSDIAEEKGYQCILAKNGETGIQYAIEYKPDAIILDIGLPDLDGWKVAEVLRYTAATRTIPIHIISGIDLENVDEYRNGIIGYLQKPLNLEKINDVLIKINSVIASSFKKVLMVDSDKNQTLSVTELLEKNDIVVECVDSGKEAIDFLNKVNYDCIILDLKLKDMSGFDFLAKLRENSTHQIPVIINTEKDLTKEDEAELKKHAECIIIKGSRSIDRLVDEVNLFLHELSSTNNVKNNKTIRSSKEKEGTLEGKKILIVDDDMRNVFALSGVLEDKGIKIVVGKNGKEGLDKLHQNIDTDLVLMDIMMPEMDGFTAIREIRKNPKHEKLPVIALTAKAMKEDRIKCIEAGANEYLSKPIDVDKLISILKVWLYK